MGILDLLLKKDCWEEFYAYKHSGGNISKQEREDLRCFIDNRQYVPVYEAILSGNGLRLPHLNEINKKNAKKKRTVFCFPREENYVLKFISYYLNKYDFLFSDNLYSFRQRVGVKHAFRNIISYPKIRSMYSYKLDISDYFNSVDTDIVISLLRSAVKDDDALLNFLSGILRESKALKDGAAIECKKGIMAGIPVSGFLANLYLKEMDEYFQSKGILYARYSDDIILFAESADKIAEYESTVKAFLEKYKLTVNTKKEFRTAPGECWEFLGFSYKDGEVDASPVSVEKIKGKMRRKARALLRWKKRKGASDERAVKAFIRHFNKKLYDNPIHNDVTWCRWYFPIINTDKSLRIIDEYMLQSIRFVASGRYSKSNYNLRYETIKSYGYRSLVNSYYKNKKGSYN